MASNDQWPPVAAAGKGALKVNGNKRNVKESQQQILSVVNEMFGSALEPEVILTVVQNCNWEMQPSIEGLITLTETVENPQVWSGAETREDVVAASFATRQTPGLKGGSREAPKTDLIPREAPADTRVNDPRLPAKWEKPKKGGAKNRMDSFCGNIAKLKSSGDSNASASAETTARKSQHKQKTPIPMDDDIMFNDILNYGASGPRRFIAEPPGHPKIRNYGDFPENPLAPKEPGIYPPAGEKPWPPINHRSNPSLFSPLEDQRSSPSRFSPPIDQRSGQSRVSPMADQRSTPMKKTTTKKEKFQATKAAAEDKEFNRDRRVAAHDCKAGVRKPESESLCGLKVQYRTSGMESSSDDDADVVIEDESSDYKINLASSIPINVSQFLSPPTQTAPRRTNPEFHMISTPSPPRTPQRNVHDSAINRIKSTIKKGHKVMILLRGLPGSGKSTLARGIVASTIGGDPASHVFNTDDYFVTLGRGVYKFDASRLQDAHNTNHKRVWNAVKEGRSPVIVDNTHVEAWEMRPYAAMAVENGYVVEILEPDTPWAQNVNELARKNMHGVPKSRIRERAKRYERVTSGKQLLERFSLRYSPQNNPPQMRLVPPFEANVPTVGTSIDDIKSNWGNHEKNNYVLTSHDIESMQNIDETRIERGEESSESSSNAERAANFREELFNDYLQELQDSDDESFEMLEGSGSENLADAGGMNEDGGDNASAKIAAEENDEETSAEAKDASPTVSQLIFGAIGSERKGSTSVGSSAGNFDGEKPEAKNLSPDYAHLTLGAIGSERKGSLSASAGSIEQEKSDTKNSSPEGSQQNLGAIGSERKGNSAGNLANDKLEVKESNGSQPTLGAIGSERKGSFSVASGVGNPEEKLASADDEIKENVLTQCWDFTLLLGRYKIHSRHSELDLPATTSRSPGTVKPEVISGVRAEKHKETVLIEDFVEDSEIQKCAADAANDDGFDVGEDIKSLVTELENFGKAKIDETTGGEDEIDTQEVEAEATNVEIQSPEPREASSEESSENDKSEKNDENTKSEENGENVKNGENDENTKSEKNGENDKSKENAENVKSEENAANVESEENAANVESEENAENVKSEENGGNEKSEEIGEDTKSENSVNVKSEENCENSKSEENGDKAKSVDACVGKIEEATEVTEEKASEIPESAPKVGTAFGSFVNMLKTILGGAEETSSDLKAENPDESGSTIYETAASSLPSEVDKDSYLVADEFNDSVDSPVGLEKSSESDSLIGLEKSSESDSPVGPDKSSESDSQIETVASSATEETAVSADKAKKIYADLSTNPFREEMIKSREENPDDGELENRATDNINSISWKESPFPLDDAEIPVPVITDDEKSVQKIDAFTNTTYYDFNVAYVGGTSEPGYRELAAVSRSINQWPSVAKPERPPVKLMLDKSSMTSEVNILATEPNPSVEREKEPANRIQELVELFPNIPIDWLTAFYNQECKGNFDWAVEVLLEDVPTDFTINTLENRGVSNDNDDSQTTSADQEKKSALELGRLKRRSHSSSPRHRRQRTKDFRSFSMDVFEDRGCPYGETSTDDKDVCAVRDDEERILQSLYEAAASATSLPIAIGEIAEASSSSTGSGPTEAEDESEELLEFDFGRELISQLEKTFGNKDFTFPEEFKPVLRMKKSKAEELHALWIQSLYDQLNERHAKLDEMIAKDEEIARALDREETVQPSSEPVVPKLEEIMDMEMAFAFYQNELKEKMARETPNDLASRLSRQMLYESLPDIEPQTLSEILKAHDGNFKETCETIENSTGRTISKRDTLRKQQSLLDRVKEERKNRGISENVEDIVAPLIVVRPEVSSAARDEKLSYKAAVARAEDARREAQKQFSLRIENFNKAAEAYRKGQPGVAAYYSQMAKLHSDNIEAAHAEAADAFVDAQFYRSDDETTLDLHNLFVPEALVALDRFLDVQSRKLGKSNKRSTTLFIITGRGARSNNGLSKIKPAVSKKLTSRNIRFTEANAGCLKVTLSKKNGIPE